MKGYFWNWTHRAYVCMFNFSSLFHLSVSRTSRNFQLWDTRDKTGRHGAEGCQPQSRRNFYSWAFCKLLSQEVQVVSMLLCHHAGLRTVSTKGKKGDRGDWILATCQEGLPGNRGRLVRQIFTEYGRLLSSRDGEHSQSQGPVVLGLLWLLSWFSHLLAAGSA